MHMWPFILKPSWINWAMLMNKNYFQYFPPSWLNMFSFLNLVIIYTCHACMHTCDYRQKKKYNQYKKAVGKNSICTINCKTKIYLVRFFLQDYVVAWWPMRQSQTDQESLYYPGAKHYMNLFPSQQIVY